MTDARRGTALLALALAVAVFAGFVAMTGGIDTRVAGIAVRSRSWERPATVAAVLLVAASFFLRHRLAGAAARLFTALPVLIIIWGATAALAFGTYAAGGADSFGYISQAELLAHGQLTEAMPAHPAFDWPDIPTTLTPLAFTRGPQEGRLVPVYPPGLPLLMAPFTWMHGWAVFLVVPICAALTLWFCVLLGRELEDPVSGTLGALLLSVSPTFLLQAVQPMSDVPVTAAWLGALLLARRPSLTAAVCAGITASLAVLIRPNLAPLVAFVVLASATARTRDNASWFTAPRFFRMVACGTAIVPGIIMLALIQNHRYGSPLGSGYGTFEDLFGWGNVRPNLQRYPAWLTMAHSAFIWVWVLAPLWFRRLSPRTRAFAWIGYAFAGAVILAYLPYVFFRREEWSYTRFLLPALPFMLVFGVGVVRFVARLLVPAHTLAAALAVVVLAAAWSLNAGLSLGVFNMRDGEQKYPRVGSFVRDRLPRTAFVMAAQHSGSLRYYSRRPTFRWDLLDRRSLERALRSLRNAGYDPFLVVDVEEDKAFRARFGGASQQTIDNMALLATIGNTAVYAFR